MFCISCSKLSILHTNKKCIRCQGDVNNNISILCESCSLTSQNCAACLKKINKPGASRYKGCNCGKK